MKGKTENRSICEELSPTRSSPLSPLPETVIKPKESGGKGRLEKGDEKETLNRRMIYLILEAFGYPSDVIALFSLRRTECLSHEVKVKHQGQLPRFYRCRVPIYHRRNESCNGCRCQLFVTVNWLDE